VLVRDGWERKRDRINEGMMMDGDVLIVDFGNGVSLVGFKDEIELLVLTGGDSKLASISGG